MKTGRLTTRFLGGRALRFQPDGRLVSLVRDGFESAFEEIFSSCELGLRKPEPEAFHAVAARIGADPRDVHFFDDSPVNVDAARAAGMGATLFASVDDVRRVLDR